MKTLVLVASLFAAIASVRARGEDTFLLGPPMKDQRHKASDFAPGDTRPGWMTIRDLPLHGANEVYLTRLRGPLEYVKGETLIWSYSFAYWGFNGSGGRVALQSGATLTFVGMAGKNLQFSTPGTGLFVVTPPPNITIPQILNFAIVPIIACNKAMVLNRLGNPTVEKVDPDTGETAFTYKQSFKDEYGIRHDAYSFKVWFDATTERVARVKDNLEDDSE